ncbi:MAG TPA: hypothetical protein PLJ21_00050 [Pseudobdellovibrionaceae bacterium]|nr:hypothetical protein [Pseudobdellovibrionaceae bacterium]
MEGLAPPLKLLLEVKRALEAGETVRNGVSQYLEKQEDSFSILVQQWLNYNSQNLSTEKLLSKEASIYRVQLLYLLEEGLLGKSIYKKINEFEQEIEAACEREIQDHLDSLHFKVLLPILFFQFPAFLLLLFGPLLNHLKN